MSAYAPRSYAGTSGRAGRYGGIALAIGLHAIVIAALLTLTPVRDALTDAAPIVVRLVSPTPKIEPKPEVLLKPLLVKPRVQRPKPVVQPPVMTAIEEAPTALVAPLPPPAPLPPLEAPPVPVAAPSPAPPAPPPAPVIPPNFNADYLNNPAPAYPTLSRRMAEEGTVLLRVLVNEQGLPAKLELRKSSGHTRLDDVALNTVRQWKFVPARRGDQAVAAWVLVPISFSLRSYPSWNPNRAWA